MYFPAASTFGLNKALGNATFLDVAEKIKHIRSVKSGFELGLIKEAARILEAGFSSLPDCVKEGMTEVDLICRLESVMRSMGHQGALRFRRFNSIVPLGHIMSGPEAAFPSFLASPTGGRGTSLVFPQGAGFRKIKRNEPIFVDSVGIYNGYIADATRIFSLGKLEASLEEAYNAACQIEEAVARELVSGKTGRSCSSCRKQKEKDWATKISWVGPMAENAVLWATAWGLSSMSTRCWAPWIMKFWIT